MNKLKVNRAIKKVCMFMLLTFTPMTFANEANLSLLFTPENAKYWQYISDRVMGGVSDGTVAIEHDGELFFARLKGNVSTKNNGGFIQLRSAISFANSEKNGNQVKGMRLNVRGNDETYHVFIRTDQMRSYSDYYSAQFEASANWQVIDLPFNKFKRNRSNDSNLNANTIRSMAIVAYGRDFISDVSVSKIEFYY